MDMFKMMKQAMSMQKEMKQIQKGLAKKTAQFSADGGLVVVTARGDMTIESIKVDPKAVDAQRVDKLEKMLVTATNGALDKAKQLAAEEMKGLTGGMGLGDLFGGG